MNTKSLNQSRAVFWEPIFLHLPPQREPGHQWKSPGWRDQFLSWKEPQTGKTRGQEESCPRKGLLVVIGSLEYYPHKLLRSHWMLLFPQMSEMFGLKNMNNLSGLGI